MIEEIQMFMRSNNQISYPSENWQSIDKIYVSGLLNLGLSDRVVFDQHNSPTLTEVIKLIHSLSNWNDRKAYDYNSNSGKIKIEIGENSKIRIYKYNLNGTLQLITEKDHYSRPGIDYMQEAIWKQILPLNRELRNDIARYIQGSATALSNHGTIKLGDMVKTTSSVKNSRQGMVSRMEFHVKDNRNYTYIVIDGKQHNRRYEDHEIVLNEIRQITQHDQGIPPSS